MYAQISSFTKQYTPQLQQRAGFFSFKAWLLLLITLSGTGLAKATEAAAAYEMRSEEHTSELQSRGHLVCRLLLEKKKKTRSYDTEVEYSLKRLAHILIIY